MNCRIYNFGVKVSNFMTDFYLHVFRSGVCFVFYNKFIFEILLFFNLKKRFVLISVAMLEFFCKRVTFFLGSHKLRNIYGLPIMKGAA